MTDIHINKKDNLAHLLALAIKLEPVLFQEVQSLASTDELTQAFNLNFFNVNLLSEVKRAQLLSYPLGVLLVAVDEPESAMTKYGSLAVDEMLKTVARLLHGNLRGTDWMARIASDEFAVILPGCQADRLQDIGHKLLRTLSSALFKLPDGEMEGIRVTVAGVVCGDGFVLETADILRAADKALQQAEEAGSKKVVVRSI